MHPLEFPAPATTAEVAAMVEDEKVKDGYTVDLTRMKIGIGIGMLVAFAYFFIGVGGKLQDFSTAEKNIVALDARVARLETAILAIPTMQRDVEEMRKEQKESKNSLDNLTKLMLAEFGNVKGLVGGKENP